MALQGTLDTFELPDVLRLLASTRKSGRLNLASDRGEGDVWLDDGEVVGVAAPGGGAVADLGDGLFELLRAREGSFVFEPGDRPANPMPGADVEPLLAAAERQLAEWREIEAVVPSLASWLALAPELPGPEATIDAETWRLVAAIGSGITVGELGGVLGLAEVPVSAVVRDVIGLGLAEIGQAPAHAAAPTRTFAAVLEPAPVVEPVPIAEPAPAPLAAPEPEAAAYEAPVFDTPAYEPYQPPTPAPASEPAAAYQAYEAYEPTYDTVSEPKAPLFVPAEAEPVSAAPIVPADDDVARQLAMLSPRAAQAVAAASPSFGDDDAAEGDGDDDEAPNRGALLRFLGSVNT